MDKIDMIRYIATIVLGAVAVLCASKVFMRWDAIVAAYAIGIVVGSLSTSYERGNR